MENQNPENFYNSKTRLISEQVTTINITIRNNQDLNLVLTEKMNEIMFQLKLQTETNKLLSLIEKLEQCLKIQSSIYQTTIDLAKLKINLSNLQVILDNEWAVSLINCQNNL